MTIQGSGFLVVVQGIFLSIFCAFAGENIQFGKKTITFTTQQQLNDGISIQCINSG